MILKKDAIKRALLQGGLVVAPRGTGKTLALAEIVAKDPDALVIVPFQANYTTMRKMLIHLGLSAVEASKRVMLALRHSPNTFLGSDKNIYVDEWAHNTYKGPFKAAVTTMPFPVKVVRS
jgi:hypothetical protein